MKAVLITTAGDATDVEVVSLRDLQDLVGGYIELVPIRSRRDVTPFVNDEGKMKGLPVNHVATDLMSNVGSLAPGDWIAGNMVIVGATQTGMMADLPEDYRVVAHEVALANKVLGT